MIKQIPVSKLEVGMYITPMTADTGAKGLRREGLIRNPDSIATFRASQVNQVWIDTDKGKDSDFAMPAHKAQAHNKAKVSLKQEREQAAKVYDEALGLVSNLMDDVKLGKAIDVTPMESLAEDINESIFNNQNALLCLSQIREKDRYLMEHSINVAILMGIFARHLGYDEQTIQQLVTGALLHDIGKIRVPDEVLHKPGKLSDSEWQEMRRHVEYGVEVLKKSPGVSEIALSICGLHHERLDGGGYPAGIKDINIYGRMAAVVDVYDAITASRVYHEGMPPVAAMRKLLEWSDNHLDQSLVYEFIRCMSVYPVGSLVELDSGKLAVVITSYADKPSLPLVRQVYSLHSKQHIKPQLLDLSSALVEQKVVATHDPKTFDIDIKQFL